MKKEVKPKITNSIINQIFSKLDIDDTYTKKKYYKFDKVKDNCFPVHGYNEMADLLILPTTDKSFKYCLTIVDLWSNYFDFEPMKTKTAKETLDSLKKIFKRNYVDQPKASLKTDNGGEFKEVFDKWLKQHKIAHLLSLPDRHKQNGNIENLNRQLGKLFMTYLSHMSMKLNEEYYNWTDIVPTVREELNKLKKHPKDEDPFTYPMKIPNITNPPKYKVGDIVYRPLEKPINGQFGGFRSGDLRVDTIPRKIRSMYLYTNNWRYVLDQFPNVAYSETELLPAKETEEKREVKAIIGKKTIKGKLHYLVWFKREKKAEASYEPKTNLIEDGLLDTINEYEESLKSNKKKK